MASGGNIHIFAGANEKGNRRRFIPNTTDEGATVGGVERILADQVFPAACQAVGRSGSSVGEGQVPGGGEVEVVAGGDLEAGVVPVSAIDLEGIGALARLEYRSIYRGGLNYFHRRMRGTGRCGRLGQHGRAENQQAAND